MPLLDQSRLTDYKHLRCAHLFLSMMSHAYVWQDGDSGAAKVGGGGKRWEGRFRAKIVQRTKYVRCIIPVRININFLRQKKASHTHRSTCTCRCFPGSWLYRGVTSQNDWALIPCCHMPALCSQTGKSRIKASTNATTQQQAMGRMQRTC